MRETCLYNYRTGKYEPVNTITSWADYIPQDEASQQAYKLRIELGATPEDAALEVREAVHVQQVERLLGK